MFSALVASSLRDASEGALEDESEAEETVAGEEARDEWLMQAAALGRVAAAASLPLLTGLLGERKARLQLCAPGSAFIPTLCLNFPSKSLASLSVSLTQVDFKSLGLLREAKYCLERRTQLKHPRERPVPRPCYMVMKLDLI